MGVPEPALSALDKQTAGQEYAQQSAMLADLEAKLDGNFERITSTVQSLRTKAEHLAGAVEAPALGSLLAGKRKLKFLSTKVMPVDAYKIRNSLYLTQPLRSPAQAAVNVLEHEDVRHMATAAKYKGMRDQTERLHQKFASSIAGLSAAEMGQAEAN